MRPRICKMSIIGAMASMTPAAVFLLGPQPYVIFIIVCGPIVAVVLGILSLMRIRVSSGQLCGRIWAWWGIIGGLGFALLWLGLLGFVFGGGAGLAR